MSLGKGGDDSVYQSPHYGSVDELGFQTILGMLTGQGITPSPEMNSNIVAEQLGGKYDSESGNISMPDGSQIKFDPLSNSFVDVNGGGAPASSQGTPGSRASGPVGGSTSPSSMSGYLEKANSSLGSINQDIYGNPDSVYNAFSSQNQKAYNPETGQYEDAQNTASQNLGADYYLDNYGQFLDQDYQASDPYSSKTYNAYDYQAPEVGSVENISDAARANIYQRGADKISSTYRDREQDTDEFIARNGSNLSSGRAGRLKDDLNEDRGRELTELQRTTDTEHELRTYNDAAHRRDLEAEYDYGTDARRGGESRYGEEFNRDEGRYGYETNRDEGRYAYEADQTQGKEKLGIAEGIDTSNRSQGFQELQANRQQDANKMTALLDMLRVYGGMDSTAASLEAAKANAMGSALGGLFGAAGSAIPG